MEKLLEELDFWNEGPLEEEGIGGPRKEAFPVEGPRVGIGGPPVLPGVGRGPRARDIPPCGPGGGFGPLLDGIPRDGFTGGVGIFLAGIIVDP